MHKLLAPNLVRWLDQPAVVRVRAFQGKSDLLKNLPRRLAGYAVSYRRNDALGVLVLVDQDTDECVKLKQEIESMARRAGLGVRGEGVAPVVLARIAVRELENWYFGDWPAVRAAFPRVPAAPPGRYRTNADADHVKTSSAFRDVLTAAGVPVRAKPEWAVRIGPHLDPGRCRSASFRTFLTGAQELAGSVGRSGSQRRRP
jgi:hypothetical protein